MPASHAPTPPALPVLPAEVAIRDVGPRDGLQPEEPVAVADRVRLVEALVASGLRRVEVAAFVSPRAVPAMAGAAEVVAALPRGVATYAALVPNRRGAEMALEAGVDELTVTISASPTYNRRNVRMEVEESVAAIDEICSLARGVPVDAVVSCAFGSPYEVDVGPRAAVDLGHRLVGVGAAALTYADTTGMATPRRIAELVGLLAEGAFGGAATGADPGPDGGADPDEGDGQGRDDRDGRDRRGGPGVRGSEGALAGVGLHLHDTRGTALVNAYAALALGISRFDTAVGGLGGSPFAHGAGGNLATEELVALLDDLGVATGIEVDRLVEAALLVEELVGRPVPSGVAHAGPRHRRSTG